MAHNSKGMGPNFVPAYQISGIPYVTSSLSDTSVVGTVQKITFPQVTRFFVVKNIHSSRLLRFGFTENGVDGGPDYDGNNNKNYFILGGGESTPRLELRCKELYFRADNPSSGAGFSLIAGLSGVPRNQFPVLTASLLYSGSDGEPLKSGPLPKFEGVG